MIKLSQVLSFRQTPSGTGGDEVTQALFLREQKHLYTAFTGGEANVAAIAGDSFQWLQNYLVARAKVVWTGLIVKVFDGLDSESVPADPLVKTQLFALVSRVVQLMRDNPDVTLEDVAHELATSPESMYRLRPETGDLLIYLVFQVVGWITALWDPIFVEHSASFSVADDGSKSRQRSLLHTPTVRHLNVKVTERNTPVYQLVTRFGDLFPNPDSLLNEADIGRFDVESACITTAYVSFHNLANIVNIKPQWTNTLNQHLEYDRRRNVLHIFAMPSICQQNLRLGNQSIFAKLFEQYRERRQNANPTYQYADFKIYLTEILVSYRLIFGQQKKSRKAIRPYLAPNKDAQSQTSLCDPLLWTLCTKENDCPKMKLFFDELGVESLGSYVSLEEFQFLGKRLLRLERISKSQNPSIWWKFWKFWSDRRDSTTWFATWAVIILGGGTLLLQLLQAVFQILQTYN